MAEHQKYRIIEKIDAGGMAEVYRGVAESLQGFKKNIAIKRILPSLCGNKTFISMFLDEARLSLHLQHANIVAVFDIGQSPPDESTMGAGTYFIVMEYVDGINLRGINESLKRQGRRLSIARTLYLMMEVCKGLAYAHQAADPETGRPLGIVHRDISPPNILLSKMGEVKLVDFGLAKAATQAEFTEAGVIKGKFAYLSPEAIEGAPVDHRTDIFAVGILLYELLTARRLFLGESDYKTVELVRQARVPSITQYNADVNPELDALVRKALARDPAQRFQSAGEMQDALAQVLFARGLKVTSRDIATLVETCLREKKNNQPQTAPKDLIDELIQEELCMFTSLEPSDVSLGIGGQPQSTSEVTGAAPLNAQSFVDFVPWSQEDQTILDHQEMPAPSFEPFDAVAPFAPEEPTTPPRFFSRVATPIISPDVHRPIASLERILEGDLPRPTSAARNLVKHTAWWMVLVLLLLAGGAGLIYWITLAKLSANFR